MGREGPGATDAVVRLLGCDTTAVLPRADIAGYRTLAIGDDHIARNVKISPIWW